MLLIYSETITSRLAYVCEFIFTRVIATDHRLTDDVSEFETYRGPRLNYSDRPFEQAFRVCPGTILFEDAVREIHHHQAPPGGDFVLFPQAQGDWPYDILSAVFFMISRYEEWLPYKADRHGRFEAAESILFRHNLLHQPVVDQWCYQFKTALQRHFPALLFHARNFRYTSTIDVDNDYAYLGKPFYRIVGAMAKDLVKGHITQLKQRLAVLSGRQKDPFDAYAYHVQLSEASGVPLIYFFLTIGRQTAYDRAVESSNPLFGQIISQVKHKAMIGIHPSYFSGQGEVLPAEKNMLEQLAGMVVTKSRQHFLRFDIKTTPRQLLAMGITEDHSMGFASHFGFRAGTCTPFRYFDLAQNEATTLEMVPFAMMDSVFYDYLEKTPPEAERLINNLAEAVMQVDGHLVSVWHDRSFSELHFPGWKNLYEKLHVTLSTKSSCAG